MSPSRLALTLLVATIAGLCAALPASAKEGVKATLTTAIPMDAAPGTELKVGWTLAYVDDGRRRLFGAGGVFVRLRSASGAGAETADAAEDTGRYTATVVVPEGGIGQVQIGLHAWAGGKPSELLFPITNEPARVVSRPSAASERADGSRTWLFVVVGSVLALGVVSSASLRRRRTASRPT